MHLRSRLSEISHYISHFGPITLVIGLPVLLAILNIDPSAHFAGWDNILAENDFFRYVKQVIGGAWLSYNGLGTPAGLAHTSEIFRLPIIGVLIALFPVNVARYVFVFAMTLVGSIGMYEYLTRYWFTEKDEISKKWLASIGSMLSVLHILTIQQFYIAFEIFTVHFAYLPWLLISIHILQKGITKKRLLFFAFIQLLNAPSGHTPTVFYLTTAFLVFYAICINLKGGIRKTIKYSLLISVLILTLNSYWISTNIYYTVKGSSAVKESRENTIFGPEALWSVNDAANITNFLRGTHYLFSWKQYSFVEKGYTPILEAWNKHFDNPVISILAQVIGIITLFGVFILIFDRKRGLPRLAIVATFAGCILFIWMGFFPSFLVIEQILSSKLLLEIFRNPFTKLSVIYGFVSVILFVTALEWTLNKLGQMVKTAKNHRLLNTSIFTTSILLIFIVSWPAFTGNYINPQLKIVFPEAYKEMYTYLKTRPPTERVLQLPQYEYVGWEYYDWSFVKKGNGYSGMGFYPFGMNQPFLQRDSDRWGDTSDYFGHELKYSLDNEDPSLLLNVMKKFQVDLLIIDESKIDPFITHDYSLDHKLATEMNLKQVWRKDFITIYERPREYESSANVPSAIKPVNIDLARARVDTAYQQNGDYVNVLPDGAGTIYPFADITKRQLKNIDVEGDLVEISRYLPKNRYNITLPEQDKDMYVTPLKIVFKNRKLSIIFPQNTLQIGEISKDLTYLKNHTFDVPDEKPLYVNINYYAYAIEPGQEQYVLFTIFKPDDLSISYGYLNEEITIDDESENTSVTQRIDWDSIAGEDNVYSGEIADMKFVSEFPYQNIDLGTTESDNCSPGKIGSAYRIQRGSSFVYTADKYGVSCNGYRLNELYGSTPYILRITGGNDYGRGFKLFVNYRDQLSQPDIYLFTEKSFDELISLPYLRLTGSGYIIFNMETRSMGKKASAHIDKMRLYTFPTNYLASIKAEVADKELSFENNAKNVNTVNNNVVFTKINVDCQEENCYVGYDESYNEAWLAIDTKNYKIYPHFVLNSWSNIWKLDNGTREIILIYWPRTISQILAVCVVTFIVIILFLLLLDKKKINKHLLPSIRSTDS